MSLLNKQIRVKNKIIAFSGLMHAGKTTCAELLETHLAMSVYYPKTIKFAQPLYDIQNYIYDRTRLEKPKTKDRKLLQYIGTDWGRSKDPNIWINLWRQSVRAYRFKASDQRDDVQIVISDDIRFENEARLVKEMGGIVVNVTAPEEIRRGRNPEAFLNASHLSENGLPEELIDLTIVNDQPLMDLRRYIRALLETGAL